MNTIEKKRETIKVSDGPALQTLLLRVIGEVMSHCHGELQITTGGLTEDIPTGVSLNTHVSVFGDEVSKACYKSTQIGGMPPVDNSIEHINAKVESPIGLAKCLISMLRSSIRGHNMSVSIGETTWEVEAGTYIHPKSFLTAFNLLWGGQIERRKFCIAYYNRLPAIFSEFNSTLLHVELLKWLRDYPTKGQFYNLECAIQTFADHGYIPSAKNLEDRGIFLIQSALYFISDMKKISPVLENHISEWVVDTNIRLVTKPLIYVK